MTTASTRLMAVLLGAAVVTSSLISASPTGSAVGTLEMVIGPAGPSGALLPADRITGLTDVVTIFNKGAALSDEVRTQAIAAAGNSGAAWALGRGATVGLRAVRRGAGVVRAAPADFQFPMSVTAIPPNAAGPIMGRDVSAVLGAGQIVMSAKSAALNAAQVGDTVDLLAGDGSIVSFVIGLVADDAALGGTELVFTPAMAAQLGVDIETRIVLWGFPTRGSIDASLVAQGLPGTDTRIRRSWDPFDPDITLSLLSTKLMLGEFAYNLSDVAPPETPVVTLGADWVNAYLPPDRELFLAEIPIRARCNLKLRADLIAALTEVSLAGLAPAIDVANANSAGGCFNPRFNRLAGSVKLGSLSRHAWGGALDTNTVANAQGAIPKMDCGVVRIFRKHNFAWGGNFLTPDGMHFEWVGSRRDQYQYPSTYCPNLPVVAGTQGARPSGTENQPDETSAATSRESLFAEDGWAGE